MLFSIGTTLRLPGVRTEVGLMVVLLSALIYYRVLRLTRCLVFGPAYTSFAKHPDAWGPKDAIPYQFWDHARDIHRGLNS